jgi:hypothetical protein
MCYRVNAFVSVTYRARAGENSEHWLIFEAVARSSCIPHPGHEPPPPLTDWSVSSPLTDWSVSSPLTDWSVSSPLTDWSVSSPLTVWSVSGLASAGIGWHRLASAGIGWHRLASAGIGLASAGTDLPGWHRLASGWHRSTGLAPIYQAGIGWHRAGTDLPGWHRAAIGWHRSTGLASGCTGLHSIESKTTTPKKNALACVFPLTIKCRCII